MRYQFATSALACAKLLRWLFGHQPGIRILIFHDIDRFHYPAFEQLVKCLHDNDALVTPEQCAEWLNGTPPLNWSSQNSLQCLLSFDDGFVGNHEVANKILSKYEAKALFFICPGLVDLSHKRQKQAVHQHILRQAGKPPPGDMQTRLMNWDQIADLSEQGHTIGAHGMLHHSLATLRGDDLRQEILLAGDLLSDRLTKPIDWYAYAFGTIVDISAAALAIISERYAYCRSGIRGLNGYHTNPWAIYADHMDLRAPPAYRKLVTIGGLDALYHMQRKTLNLYAAAAAAR